MSELSSLDPVSVENMRARLESELFRLARDIGRFGFVPTITLTSAVDKPVTGEFNIEVDVRYGKAFYRDDAFRAFIEGRMKAQAALQEQEQP